MAYSEKCTGTYIGNFTLFDPVEFNKALNEGCTVQEATHRLKGTDIIVGAAFYPLFSYTVDGVEYIRASYRLKEHFGRSAGSANMWMKGAKCVVCYDPENPGDAVVEDRKGTATEEDIVPVYKSKTPMKWILIAAGVFAAFTIMQFILHALLLL